MSRTCAGKMFTGAGSYRCRASGASYKYYERHNGIHVKEHMNCCYKGRSLYVPHKHTSFNRTLTRSVCSHWAPSSPSACGGSVSQSGQTRPPPPHTRPSPVWGPCSPLLRTRYRPRSTWRHRTMNETVMEGMREGGIMNERSQCCCVCVQRNAFYLHPLSHLYSK